jgi:4-aminobutyrate aminotransferase-like enzyme
LEVVHFVCSGSEANELALRMAHNCAGRHDTIVLSGAYHGNTRTLIDISPYKHCGPGGDGAPSWVHSADMPDRYRGRYRGHSGEVGRRYAEQIALILEGLAADGQGPAATFIAESAMGCGGQIILPDGYLRAAYDAVRGSGGICIADEVQVGFGRAGSHFWMFETQSVVPDIVTLGKPMGNGHPLGAVVTTRAIADAFANGMEYFNTFGGNPVSCAIGNAVLDVIDDEDLQARAATVGTHFCKGLHELKKDHSLIGDVRGRGLFIGVEFVTDHLTRTPATAHAARAVERLRDHGILSSTDGPAGNVVKFKPPMAFTRADADRVVCTLDSVLAENRLREV